MYLNVLFPAATLRLCVVALALRRVARADARDLVKGSTVRFTQLARVGPGREVDQRVDKPVTMKLGHLVRIARGVVTGNASLFIITRSQAKEHGIEAFVKPILAGKREFPPSGTPIVRNSADRMVMLIASQRDVERNIKLEAYLGDVKPKLATARPAPIAVNYVGRPRFIANPDGLLITNALYTATPLQNMSSAEVLKLVERLNRAMESLPTTRFVTRFSPRAMEQIEI